QPYVPLRSATTTVVANVVMSLLLTFLASCSFIPRESFTAQEQAIAEIPGMPGVRFWADANAPEIRTMLERPDLEAAINETGRFDVLALSGGAYDGAYGA